MKRRILRIAFLVVAVTAPVAVVAIPLALAPNDPAPTVGGVDLQGAPRRLDWGSHRLSLVNFWASWCAPCQRELPRLQQLYAKYGEQGLQVVGISKDRLSAVEIAAWLEPLGIEYTILLDGGLVSRAWGGVGTLPTTFLIDERGIVLRRYVGGAKAAIEAVERDVEAFMEGRPLGPPYLPQSEPEVSNPEVMNR